VQLPSGVAGRGVVQLSAYVDMLIASFMPRDGGGVRLRATIYCCGLLFGMSVSARRFLRCPEAEARDKLHAQRRRPARHRLPVVPTVAAFLLSRRDLRRALPDRNSAPTTRNTLYS